MAQRVQVLLEDDLDGSEADETVTFGLDGAEYEVDLSATNAESLRDALAPWVGVARRTGGRRKRASQTRTASRSDGSGDGGASAGDVRTWAVENGYEVSSRGRVPAEVRDAYARAHS